MKLKASDWTGPLILFVILAVGLRGNLPAAFVLWTLILVVAKGAILVAAGSESAVSMLKDRVPSSFKSALRKISRPITRVAAEHSLKLLLLGALILVWQWDRILQYERGGASFIGLLWMSSLLSLLGLVFPPTQLLRSLIIVGVGWCSGYLWSKMGSLNPRRNAVQTIFVLLFFWFVFIQIVWVWPHLQELIHSGGSIM
jgi:hypothetical protein